MTIINPNSIAGITSVTAEAGVMNFYKSDGTLAGLQLNGVNFNTTSGISTFNNVYVGGTITYEDVKNVDSVGIITARSGIDCNGNATFGANGSITTGSNFSLNGNALTVTGSATVVGEFKRAGNATIQCTDTTNSTDLQLRANATGGLVRTASNKPLVFGTNQTERLRIDSGGRLLLGTTTEGAGTYAETLTIAGTTHCGMTIRSATNGVGSIYFSDGTSGNSEYRGYFEYSHTADEFKIATAATERLRITSGGQVLIGSTSAATSNTFLEVKNAAAHTELTIISKNDSGALINLGDTDSYNQGRIKYDNSDNSLTFRTSATDRLSITSAGSVRVGNNASFSAHTAADDLVVGATSGSNGMTILTGAATASIFFNDGSGNDGVIQYVHSASPNYMRLASSGQIEFDAGGDERLRITSGGALLVGLTSPTYNSGDMQHEIKKNNSRTYTAPLMTGHSHLLLNNSDTTNNCFTGLGFRAGSGDGSIGYVYRGSANNADFVVNTDGNGNGVERLRVFNNGSVLIGALSGEAAGGSSSSGSARLVIDCEGLNIYNAVGNAANYGLVFANDYNSNTANGIGFFNDGGTDCGGYIVHQDKGANNIGDLVFATSATADTPVERVRIKSNGEVDISDNVVIHSVGNSQAVDIEQQTDGNYMNIRLRNFYTGSAKNMMAFLDQNGNVRGSIVINNSNTTYNTSSDYRLKENEVPISDGIERLKLLKPYRFNWKDDPSITLDGFFAHEVTPAVPEAIVNEKDGEIDEEGNGYQQMDYAKITPLLTAALQEAIAEIETLKAEVATLKSA